MGAGSLLKGEIKVQEYIVNLTDDFIRRHRFAALRPHVRRGFFAYVKDTIAQHDVARMSPETLGRIMCSLKPAEVLVYEAGGFLGMLKFRDDCGDLLRQAVTVALACVIRNRLDPATSDIGPIPPYTGR